MDNLMIIDLEFQGRSEAIASYLLYDGEEAALIETGPTSTMGSLLAGLDAAGVAPEQVHKLLLTHIHLDHAGASGNLMDALPNATVYVHEVGAPHLVDPSKLLHSATRIYGDDMEQLWGEVRPVPEDRLVVLHDGEKVEVAGQELVALYTPGHASHHIAYWAPGTRELFTGDVAGVRLPGTERAMPPTPPPDLNLEEWSDSIRRIQELEPETLYLTHFGPVDDAARHMEELHGRLYDWRDFLLAALRQGRAEDELPGLLEEYANKELAETVTDPEVRARFRLVSGYTMNVAGYMRYFRKHGHLPA